MPHYVRWIALVLVLVFISTQSASSGLLLAQSTGQHDSNWFGGIEAHDAPELASELGITWSRARFHWGSIQPTGPNDWIDAELTDDEFGRELAEGREVIGLLIGVPEWAQDETGLPAGLELPDDDDGNLWAAFVRTVAERYRGRIDRWIIWNEPDIWDSEHPAYSWPGTERDFAQLMAVSYRVIKDVNPDATVHLGAMSHFWDVLYGRELYIRRLLAILTTDQEAAANNYYYDAATLHLYFNPADVYAILSEYQQIQSEFGIDKPIWLIETNAPPSSDPSFIVQNPTFQISLAEQAAYMPQAILLARAAGAERIGVYKMVDTPGDFAANPELFGLVRGDGTIRPGFYTAQTVARLLDSGSDVNWHNRHIVSQVVLSGSDKVLRAFWVRVPYSQTVSVPALAESAEIMDMWGNRSALVRDDDWYTLTLPAGECTQTVGDYCMIGGPPVFVIEQVNMSRQQEFDIDIVMYDDEAGQIRSDTVSSRPLLGGLLGILLIELSSMYVVVRLSRHLRLQFNLFGEQN